MALAGKHALVTGGGRGIGRAIAAALAGAGAAVTVVGRSEAPLRATVAAGEAAGCAVADVTDAVEVRRQVTAAEAARGPIAILVNNAGSVQTGAFVKADPSVFQAMWDVHVMGAVYATPGGAARHDRARLRPDRQRRLHLRAARATPMSAPIARRSTRWSV